MRGGRLCRRGGIRLPFFLTSPSCVVGVDHALRLRGKSREKVRPSYLVESGLSPLESKVTKTLTRGGRGVEESRKKTLGKEEKVAFLAICIEIRKCGVTTVSERLGGEGLIRGRKKTKSVPSFKACGNKGSWSRRNGEGPDTPTWGNRSLLGHPKKTLVHPL